MCTKSLKAAILKYSCSFVAITTIVSFKCYDILEKTNGGAIRPEQAFIIFQDVIYLMMYLTAMTVGWWFGDRSSAKFLKNISK